MEAERINNIITLLNTKKKYVEAEASTGRFCIKLNNTRPVDISHHWSDDALKSMEVDGIEVCRHYILPEPVFDGAIPAGWESAEGSYVGHNFSANTNDTFIFGKLPEKTNIPWCRCVNNSHFNNSVRGHTPEEQEVILGELEENLTQCVWRDGGYLQSARCCNGNVYSGGVWEYQSTDTHSTFPLNCFAYFSYNPTAETPYHGSLSHTHYRVFHNPHPYPIEVVVYWRTAKQFDGITAPSPHMQDVTCSSDWKPLDFFIDGESVAESILAVPSNYSPLQRIHTFKNNLLGVLHRRQGEYFENSLGDYICNTETFTLQPGEDRYWGFHTTDFTDIENCLICTHNAIREFLETCDYVNSIKAEYAHDKAEMEDWSFRNKWRTGDEYWDEEAGTLNIDGYIEELAGIFEVYCSTHLQTYMICRTRHIVEIPTA